MYLSNTDSENKNRDSNSDTEKPNLYASNRRKVRKSTIQFYVDVPMITGLPTDINCYYEIVSLIWVCCKFAKMESKI